LYIFFQMAFYFYFCSPNLFGPLIFSLVLLLQGLDAKKIVFKYKKKKNYRRNIGHRQVNLLCFSLQVLQAH
jgi:hypothetical protein